tara:strand:+ start:364 stop:1401 length:1038 start_codon:yes stop_codon:yes gene_type:complete
MPSVSYSVVIVNYNGGDYLQKAVNSLAVQTNQDFEIIIIDNASSDESMNQLDTNALSKCRIVMNAENVGFAVANNMAAKLATGRWLVLLNPDAAAEPDWIEKLDCATEQYPGCRTFTSAQYDMHNVGVMDGAGDAYLVFGIPWRGGYGQSLADLPETGHCFSACGAGAVYDRQLFLNLGGFDERFFCYCEDVDLGFRLQLMGETCIFVRDAVIHHAGSAISGEGSPFSTYHGTRNRIWTYFKNMPLPLLILTLPAHIAISIYLLIRSMLNGRFKSTAQGVWHGIRYIPGIMIDQRWRTTDRRVSVWELARTMAWNPLRMGRRATHVRQPSEDFPAAAVLVSDEYR